MSRWTKQTAVVILGMCAVVMLGSGELTAEEVDPTAYSDQVDRSAYQPAPETRQDGTVSAPLMVSLAYGFFWVLTVAFLFSLWTRGKTLTDEIAAANGRLAMLEELSAEVERKNMP